MTVDDLLSTDGRSAADATCHCCAGQLTNVDIVRDRSIVEQFDPDDRVVVLVRQLIDLQRKLASQPAIDQAKGVIMGYYGVSEAAAFQVLRRWSQTHDLNLRTVAALLIEAVADGSTQGRSPQDVVASWVKDRATSSETPFAPDTTSTE